MDKVTISLRRQKDLPDQWQATWEENGQPKRWLIGPLSKYPRLQDAQRAFIYLLAQINASHHS